MKKTILIITAIATCFLYSCKKDTSNRITNVTYELDSVRIEFLDENDSITTSFTMPISQTFFDTFISQNSYPSLDASGFFISNDSLIYLNQPDRFITTRSVVYNKIPVSYHKFYPYGNFAQYGYDEKDVNYNYNASMKLSSINYTIKHHNAVPNFADSDYINKIQLSLNYTNNNLAIISEDFVRLIFNNYNSSYDSIIYPTDPTLGTFTYTSNYANQKDLIGLDLNDLILNPIIGASSSDDLYFGHLISILQNQLSYNTKSASLIEQFKFKTHDETPNPYTTNTCNIQYTFDASNNNRIKTMYIKSNFDLFNKILYTFYYKD